MTQRTDPRLIIGALSMVRLPTWGLKGNLALLVRLLTVEAGADWAEISRRDAAAWMATGREQARRLLDELVADEVLERRQVGGQRGHFYRFRDPRGWRRVPWRFRDDNAGDRLPELVRHRLDGLAQPAPVADRAVVAFFDAQRRPTTQNAVFSQPRRRVRKLRDLASIPPEKRPQPDDVVGDFTPEEGPQIDDGPTTTSREPTGSGPARGGSEKSEVEPAAPAGDRKLTGAAEEVRRAIVRTGRGSVRGKLLDQLAAGFADVPVDLLGPVLAAIEERGRDRGQKTPWLVDLAVDMIEAGAASITPAITGKKPEVVLAELYDQEVTLKREMADAEADGASDVAAYFREALATCQNRIAQITGEEATG